MALALSFDFFNSIIQVPAPDTTLDIQYLINQIRDNEDELNPGLVYAKIADAAGKDDLGGGVTTGITVRLLGSWQVRFEARAGPTYVQCSITGGNLVGGPGGNPIATSAFTQVKQVSSASSTIATPATASDQTNLKYMVESLRDASKTVGTIYYWDPTSGNDTNNGSQPTSAVRTFAQAHTLVTSGNNDVVFCLASDSSGLTTVTETLNITKKNLRVRGPGYIFQLIPTTTTADTITVSADNVEISGLYMQTAATGTRNAVTLGGTNNTIKDCWIANVQSNGVNITSPAYAKITSCVIEHCGKSATGDGIAITTGVTQAVISKNIVFDNVNGISLVGSTTTDNIIDNNIIYNHTGYGVTIGTGVLRTHVRGGNTFNKNTAGDTQNLGTNTFIESIAGGATPSQIAVAVWDEVIAGHLTTGTTGKTLKDAKTKATLASLK